MRSGSTTKVSVDKPTSAFNDAQPADTKKKDDTKSAQDQLPSPAAKRAMPEGMTIVTKAEPPKAPSSKGVGIQALPSEAAADAARAAAQQRLKALMAGTQTPLPRGGTEDDNRGAFSEYG